MSIVRGAHARLRIFLVTLLGQDNPTALDRRYINPDLLEIEMELEEYSFRYWGFKAYLPDLIIFCV